MAVAVAWLVCLGAWTQPAVVAAVPPHDDVNFFTDIRPIFNHNCVACHGPEREEMFRIDDHEQLLWYVIPGDVESSELYLRVTSDDEGFVMPPPDEGRPLTDAQIAAIRTWIEQGAEFVEPAEEVEEVVREPEEYWMRLWKALGALHPITVHFPIGLLVTAGLFALLSLRGNYVMSDCAFYCLWLGVVAALVSGALGWSFAELKGYSEDPLDRTSAIFWHRWTSIIATVLALLVAIVATIARRRDPENGLVWKLGLVVVAILVGITAHQGGKLSHPGTYDRLFDLMGIAAEEEQRAILPDGPAGEAPLLESGEAGPLL